MYIPVQWMSDQVETNSSMDRTLRTCQWLYNNYLIRQLETKVERSHNKQEMRQKRHETKGNGVMEE